MKKVDKDQMAKGYVEMGNLNIAISEEYNTVELKEYLEREVNLDGSR